MATVTSSLSASEIRTKKFTHRRGAQAAQEVATFLGRVADHVEGLDRQVSQLSDQLALAEADRRAAAELRTQLADSVAEVQILTDRVALAESVRDAAIRTCDELEAEVEKLANREPLVVPAPALEAAALGPVATADAEQIIKDAAESAARTRADAHTQARQILDEAQKASEAVRAEQQRWAGEAERSLRARLDELAAEADSRFLDAREASARILTSAGEEAERIIAHASTEADRMLSEARSFGSALSNTSLETEDDPWPTAPSSAHEVVLEDVIDDEATRPRPVVDAATLLAKAAQLVRAAEALAEDEASAGQVVDLSTRIADIAYPEPEDVLDEPSADGSDQPEGHHHEGDWSEGDHHEGHHEGDGQGNG